MNALTTDRTRGHATGLGLTHLTETITALVERAETAQLGYLEFVDLLLEEEVGLRESRRFRNALKLSGLPHHKTLEEFDFAFQPTLDTRKVRDLATLEFIRAKANVALLGPPGVGKTMLAGPLAFSVGALIFAALTVLGLKTQWQVFPRQGAFDIKAVGMSLLTTHSLVFELISIVLLMAIIGALVLAQRGRN